MRGTLKLTTAAIALCATLAAGAPALAQSGGSSGSASTTIPVPTRSGVVIYEADFFVNYTPVTALDIVQRVPGFRVSNGDTNRRGLGDAFGNVLINGTRPANKALTLETVLQRIPKDDVMRVELIQEAMPDFDMRGHSRLVNVIVTSTGESSGSWGARLRLSPSGRIGPGFNVSQTSTHDDVEVTLALSGGWMGNRIRRRFSRWDENDVLTEIQHDNDQRHYQEYIPSIGINWTINENSSLRLNLEAQEWEWRREQISIIDQPVGGVFEPLRIEHAQSEDDHGGSRLGSMSYSNALSNGFSLETMALIRREEWFNGPETYASFDPVAGFTGSVIVRNSGEYEESALRQTLSFDPNENHSVEFGGEIAVNARDTSIELFSDDGVTVTPIVLPVANTRVEETRSEIFANHVWTINDALSLESGLRYEMSEIVQTGDANQTRSFAYAKPSITLNWRRDDQNRFRVTGRRDVAQLQFGKFASSVDVADNNSTLGNPDYVPQRTWTIEAEWQRSFGHDGSLSLRVGQDWIEDLDGFVAITTPSGVFDAPGNIGDGTNFRVTANLTTPLDGFGIPNATLVTFAEWYNTNIEDPLTGEDRMFDGYREWEFSFDFRQTFPESQMAWGWDYHWVSDGEVYRARESRVFGKTDGDLDLYVETTRWGGITTRLGVDAVINNGDDRQRVFYDGSRADGIVAATEYRNESMGSTWYLSLRGTF